MILVEAPSNLGLKEPEPRVEPGVKYFAAALREEGFAERAGIKENLQLIPPTYSGEIDPETRVRNGSKIISYSKELANIIRDLIRGNRWPIVIGGDCSILIGAALGLRQLGNYALFFIDGHTDYSWPTYSETGGAAGMDLAIVTGNGHDRLTDMHNLKPYIQEENVFCAGNRYYPEWYVELVRQSRIHYFDLILLRETGIGRVVQEFLQMVADKKLDGFWIHLDVDVLNDEIMPCVDSRQEDGLSYDELRQAIEVLIVSPHFSGMDISILDPTLDKDRLYTRQFVSEMAAMLKQR
jgi:arginase